LCQKTKDNTSTTDLVSSFRDTTVLPGNDFFQYANGTWIQKHPIPASESNWSIGRELQDEIYGCLRKINEAATQATAQPGQRSENRGFLPDRDGYGHSGKAKAFSFAKS
jgi:putative endopeptidase